MRSTNIVFLEVMRKDNPKLLSRIHELAVARNNHYDHMRAGLASMRDNGPAEAREGLRAGVNFAQREMDRKFDQAARIRSRLRKYEGDHPSFWSDKNLRRAKWGVGLATVGAGVYGAYRLHKKNQQQKQKAMESTSECYLRLLRETEGRRITADHVALGLDVLKATGFDQAMARQMGDEKQRSQAWKYGLRGAALGASLPILDVAQENIRGLGHRIIAARNSGVSGVGNILRTAKDAHFGEYKGLPEQLARAYAVNPAMVGKITAGLAGAGALYGLMKKAPDDKKPTPTLMKPKKQYKYIRKDGEKYVYPKKIGVKR